ncbi:DUF4870 domain-containing protein [Natronolimnohabitans innermongolicus]|uniref:DUF4870 domain-containing protein n=1 Tax=Natronolimnohabitans innermongolicus JCM 12255 TaxID=1227499 RepID=L9WQ67_9EURY|nr:DUF4870 domain-containing protein [Natronolimnohabitans innermongolicus]ELY51619.1 hypothetical protein C493_16856 [Natronolimnohabitans innermongolicus JCM 12255]
MVPDTATPSVETAATRSQSTVVRTLAAGTHLLALVTWIVGPLLVMWLSRSEYAKEHARNALNWQLTVGIVAYVAGALVVATSLTSDSLFVLWSSVLGVLVLGANLLFCAVAAVRALRGEQWEYPVAIRVTESTDVSRTF